MTESVPAFANPETATYWEAASKGKLLLKSCNACGAVHFYPRNICPHCFSDETSWVESRERGKIYTLSTMRRAGAPYVIAYVSLEEGVAMLTNILCDDPADLAIGDAVDVEFIERDGRSVPVFRKREAGASE
ncbi:Zn-ribbon domain-containing OB-fold protein [Chelatococcus sp. YT9]|uniref:Zn-ribbon domain-containing OB-fold protein n=1 Tax=Chelatococcus sp. YT9 TaxID=2835635 RepID=UPI001BCCFB60|nr:Zn-ribbon domain-containing OB-fold protein [Chelatococcus sp. YT9]MBS7701378.1 Zn-ribbon domain-containing OB-fold protein [Chelatococcus sp. YT9]